MRRRKIVVPILKNSEESEADPIYTDKRGTVIASESNVGVA